jgi:hypothetical protein
MIPPYYDYLYPAHPAQEGRAQLVQELVDEPVVDALPMKPKVEKSLRTLLPLQTGQRIDCISLLLKTRSSNFLLHLSHQNSIIGITWRIISKIQAMSILERLIPGFKTEWS